MKHKIITIGGLGQYACYLDLSKEEAVSRYNERYGSIVGAVVGSIEFIDSFEAYDLWATEEA